MPSVDFDISNAGGVATPRMVRSVNVPTAESFAYSLWLKILSYEDFLQVFALQDTTGSGLFYTTQATLGGALRQFESDGGTQTDLWADTFAGWANVAASGSAANVQAYYRRQGGVWTSAGTVPSPSVGNPPTDISIGDLLVFPGNGNGRMLLSAIKMWNVTKTSIQLEAESNFTSVQNAVGLTFFNASTDHTTVHVDQSTTGGDFTMFGTAATSSDDPGIPFGPNFGLLSVPRPQKILDNNARTRRGVFTPRGRSASFPSKLVPSFVRSRPAIAPSRPGIHSAQVLSTSIRQQFAWHTVFTRFGGKNVLLEGITRDCDENPVGGMEVRIYRDSDGAFIGSTTSDGVTGAWFFAAPPGATYEAVAWKAGVPNLAGTTGRGLIPA